MLKITYVCPSCMEIHKKNYDDEAAVIAESQEIECPVCKKKEQKITRFLYIP